MVLSILASICWLLVLLALWGWSSRIFPCWCVVSSYPLAGEFSRGASQPFIIALSLLRLFWLALCLDGWGDTSVHPLLCRLRPLICFMVNQHLAVGFSISHQTTCIPKTPSLFHRSLRGLPQQRYAHLTWAALCVFMLLSLWNTLRWTFGSTHEFYFEKSPYNDSQIL